MSLLKTVYFGNVKAANGSPARGSELVVVNADPVTGPVDLSVEAMAAMIDSTAGQAAA